MKMYRVSGSDVLDRASYSKFVNLLRSGRISWSSDNEKFKNTSNIQNFRVFEKAVFASVDADKGKRTPSYRLIIKIYQEKNGETSPSKWIASLYSIKGNSKIADFGNESDGDCIYTNESGSAKMFLQNIKLNITLPMDERDFSDQFEKKAVDVGGKIRNVILYKRMTKTKSRFENAKSLEVWAEERKSSLKKNSNIYYLIFRGADLEDGVVNDIKTVTGDNGNLEISRYDLLDVYNEFVNLAKNNGFVEDDSYEYIPETANESNWDFVSNQSKEIKSTQMPIPQDLAEEEAVGAEDDEMDFPKLRKRLFREYQMKVESQDFGGYYSGSAPDAGSLSSYIGSSSVESSQISSVFGKTDEAVAAVNQFNSDLLKNIAFIFNSQGGSYGVYLSEMDRAIKTKFLEDKLKQNGYQVRDENGNLVAYPKDETEISSEEIQKEIDTIYQEIDKSGGTAIGINMSKIMESAQQDVNNIPSDESQFLLEQLIILHLGETIVHEAVHAKGSMSEGPSESAESQFVNWYLPQINQKYMSHLESLGKEDEFNEIVVGTEKRHAQSKNWYKFAQAAYGGLFSNPKGSDLHGRMQGTPDKPGLADWGLMFNQHVGAPIESKLGRQFMWPLAQDIQDNKDSIEAQLRKTFGHDENASGHTEELLEKDRNWNSAYKHTEELLEEERPSPLLVTIKKEASITKEATVFGWYNNLEISDGNTIPGLGDRVMEWDDRDEDFAEEESWIRSLPRYNPSYDPMGFYYRFIEPRFKPELWDDMTRDLSNTHPAKRFAETGAETEEELATLKKVIIEARRKLASKKVSSIRFILSEDILDLISSVFSDYQIVMSPLKADGEENIFALWVAEEDVKEQDIINAEKYFSEKDDEFKEIADDLTGVVSYRKKNMEESLSLLNVIQKEEDLSNIYMVGECAREYLFEESITTPYIHFVCEDQNDTIKYGEHFCRVLGLDYNFNSNNDLIAFKGDYKIAFQSGSNPKACEAIRSISDKEYNLDNPIVAELLNKDFTINMIGYSVCENKVFDPFGVIDDINEKVLKTYFSPDLVVDSNPAIIVRAVKFVHKDGYKPSELLMEEIEQSYMKLSKIDSCTSLKAREFWEYFGI